ncbi:NADPH-dependent glutamate synthase [Hippea maritima]|uniref:Glutamate synthase (NADPH), homotetrameric n=1 Tax=Hippea maritima (strain ATCC 700847 / DSM 10411 / MH2) TaxID=760142 RepID=F2LXM2_HIPMA|nr:NADPH-dependent glutamate synthase [Hippea maritima]AEA33208.1 glutamate synthase (NADPH), homotetrameric [Hippea maritima DSM 10411]
MAERIKPAEKFKRDRVPMKEQDPKERVKNFNEVPYGYSLEEAIKEAQRCLQCKPAACVEGCPADVHIPQFIDKIIDEDIEAAFKEIKITNALPAVCGRVCPQEEQCEGNCVMNKKGKPIAIGRLERFVADWAREHGIVDEDIDESQKKGKKVAIVGSGPAGLACAADLAKLGYDVTVFEALHKPGGVLIYGIPEFRLPKSIVNYEVEQIKKMGVKIYTDYVIGYIKTVDELVEEYDAVFLANGAGAPSFLGIPGENLNGVYSASEFLTRSNLMRAFDFPEFDTPIQAGKRVVVIGGGNVAMDAVRTAKRLGAEEAIIVYRRSRAEMPARAEEIEHAEAEGIRFELLTNPIRVIGDENGNVKGLECVRMELGEPDESGRRRPVPIEGSNFVMDVDNVIVAIGQNANPIVARSATGVETNKWGYFVADEETGKTTHPKVWAGGDIVTGAATVILAVGAGKKAAKSIHETLSAQ